MTEKLTELETYENKLKEKTQEEPVAEEFVVNEDQQKIQKEFAELMNINPESMTSEELSNFLNRINKCYEVGYNKAYLTDEQSDTLMNLGKSVHGKIFADQSEVEKPQQEPVVAEDTADEEVVVNEDQQKIQKEFEELMNTDYSSMSNEDLVKLYDRVNECYWNGFNKNYLTIEQCETLVNLGKNIHDKVFTEQSEVEKPQQEPVVAEEVIEETPVEEVQPEVVVESIEDDDKKSTVQIDPIDLTSYSDGQIIFDENGALRVYVDSQRSKSENETITEPQSDEDKIKEYKARFAQYNGGKEFNLKDFIKGMESSKKLGKADKYLQKFEEYISKCIGEMVANSNDPEFVKFGKAHIKKIKDVAWNEIGSNNAYSASIEKVGKELSKDGKNKEVLKELELFVHPGQKYSPGVLLEYEIPEKISSDKELEALLDNIEQTRELLAFYEEEGIQNSWADALEQHVEKALSVMDAYVQALNEKDVEEVKPEVIEEIVEDTPIEEQPEVIEEAVEEVIEETPVEEVQPEIIEKVIPEIVAEQPVEEVQPEVIEEVVEEQPIEELQSEVVEQVIEEVVEETPVEEVQPEVIEEVVPEIVEEQPVEEVQPEVIEEVVPEIVEEQSVEEVQPEVIEEVVEDTQPKVVPFAALNPETFTEEEAAAYADFRMSQEYDPTQIAEDLKNGNKRLQFSKLSKKKGAVLEIVDLKENADESQS